MTQLIAEDRISLQDLAHELGVDRTTVRRWADTGFRGHRLESFQLGRKRFSSRQAAARFVAAISARPALARAAT